MASPAATCPAAQVGEQIYLKWLSHPPPVWVFCELSLSKYASRKISPAAVALVPGATMRVTLDLHEAARTEASLEVLASYEGMGIVRVECLGGCACIPLNIDAHRPENHASTWTRHSLVLATSKEPRNARSCILQVSLLHATSSGGTRFSLRSVLLSAV
jgi:hypothetical protein